MYLTIYSHTDSLPAFVIFAAYFFFPEVFLHSARRHGPGTVCNITGSRWYLNHHGLYFRTYTHLHYANNDKYSNEIFRSHTLKSFTSTIDCWISHLSLWFNRYSQLDHDWLYWLGQTETESIFDVWYLNVLAYKNSCNAPRNMEVIMVSKHVSHRLDMNKNISWKVHTNSNGFQC